MTDGLVLRARGSHLYPGARVVPEGGAPERATPCIVEFADGSAAMGEVAPAGEGRMLLATAPYHTAAGTEIPAKRWLLQPGAAGEWQVARRASAGQGR